MKITFIGATHEVTGSCYYLEAAGKKFLVDCGMEQGPDYYQNQEIPVNPGDLDFVLLTHAHMQPFRKPARYLCERLFGSDLCDPGNLSSLRYHAP